MGLLPKKRKLLKGFVAQKRKLWDLPQKENRVFPAVRECIRASSVMVSCYLRKVETPGSIPGWSIKTATAGLRLCGIKPHSPAGEVLPKAHGDVNWHWQLLHGYSSGLRGELQGFVT